MPVKLNELVEHTATFAYSAKKIPYTFWSNTPSGGRPDTILFLGTGQTGKIPKWVATMAPPGVVVVEGLPHWHSKPSGEDLKEFTQLYTESAFQTVLHTFRSSRMHIIGVSQATPGTVWLANDMPEKVGNVALVLPMGLTTHILGMTDIERFKELRKRSVQTLMQTRQSPIHDIRNIYISTLLAKIVFSGLRDRGTVNKYTAGISQDLLPDFKLLVASKEKYKRHVSLVVGANDKIFPLQEIEQTLAKAKIKNISILVAPKTTHSSLAIKSSKPIISTAVSEVRKSK